MHIIEKKLQAPNKLSKWYVDISDSVLLILWFKEGGVRNLEEL